LILDLFFYVILIVLIHLHIDLFSCELLVLKSMVLLSCLYMPMDKNDAKKSNNHLKLG